MPTSEETSESSATRIIIVTLVVSLAYAVVRYHIAGPVPWKDFPFFILNKAIALAAFLLLTYNFVFGPLNNLTGKVPLRWLNARKALGMTGFLLAVIHVFMSFLLFNPANYARFFGEDGTMTLLAGLSMVAGVLGFVFLWGYNLSFQTHLREDKAFIRVITSRSVLLWALALGGLHLFFMGYQGWLNPAGWHGGIPPISLVGFAFFTVGYLINLLGRE